jgi:dipeptidyl aminopeptidase/acylaminoacyl peptidase
MIRKPCLRFVLLVLVMLSVVLATGVQAAGDKALTYQDIMRFKEIRTPVISQDGLWVAFGLQPDRGDGTVIVRNVKNGTRYTIARGTRPALSGDAGWAAAIVRPGAVETAKAKKQKPKQGLALLNLGTGEAEEFAEVQTFAFSEDSRWLAFHHFKPEDKPDEKKPAAKKPEGEEKKEPPKPKVVGTTLVLKDLSTGEVTQIAHVLHYAFDQSSRFLAFVVADPEGRDNGLFYTRLNEEGWSRNTILQKEMVQVTQLTWSEKGSLLAFVAATLPIEGPGDQDASLWIWDGAADNLLQAVTEKHAAEGWYFPEKNRLSWSMDGRRLFFGFKPAALREKAEEPEKKIAEEGDLIDVDLILAESEVDVWHWDDPFINPQQKIMWSRVKDRTYAAVYHIDSQRIVSLADEDMPRVQTGENPDVALGFMDAPYRKMVTWYGSVDDLYLVDLKTGTRTRVAAEIEDRSSLSPGGRYVVYYQEKHWHLYDRNSQATRNLTADMDVPFCDEDHDYPSSVPSYGTAGWTEGDAAVLINDKYDVWSFPTRGGEPVNITGGRGRKENITFRVIRTDREKEYFEAGERLLLSAHHNHEKHWGFYSGPVGGGELKRLLEEKKKFSFLAKAKGADTLLYTRESYTEFPDLWVSDPEFASPQKVSDANPQMSEFAWGTAELVEWESVDGIPLQGVLIKPGNYEPGKRYPVIVYYYRFFSQRIYEFNQTVINHRPNFPFYASNGYAVFLPDIRFAVGLPGFSATKCLVPGVQKLIDIGVADPDAIGLHGHSWSGYQTAFVITQTDIFRCAVAGAPVSNMTSAYSGIRWASGMARQFQYEQSQSRIGASLWERRDLYIDNSPVFFADRINTPLLIIHGDEDGAVPWYQSIELYLALRRLGKDCIFLQYRGEPHHPQKYPNKLDWFKKMKEYFDHYLKGEPGADWITKGIEYRGK